MTDRVQLVSLAEQIGAIDRARRIVGGGARVPQRPSERDYDTQALEAARCTLQWLRAHEAEVRAAVAPRRPSSAPSAAAAQSSENDGGDREDKSRPCEFPLARRAAMRCAEGAFQKFIGAATAEGAADALRHRCGVESRKDLDRDAAARERWRALDAEFGAWLRCAGEPNGSAGA